MRQPTRLLPALAVTAALVTAGACTGDSGNDSGNDADADSTAFCDELLVLSETEEGTDAENLAALQRVADAAPPDIEDAADTLVETFGRLQAFDVEAAGEDDLDDAEQTLADFDAAGVTLESYAEENCPDLPDNFFTGG